MGKFKFHSETSFADLIKRIPTAFHDSLSAVNLEKFSTFDIFVFSTNSDKVVLSGTIKKTAKHLSSYSSQTCRLAFAGNFTFEARKLLQESHFIVITISDFHWTDQSYQDIRIF